MWRDRSRGGYQAAGSFPELAKWHPGSCTAGFVPDGWYFGGIALGSSESMSDFIVPRYHRRAAEGEVFFNPLIQTRHSASSQGGFGYHVIGPASGCAGNLPREYKCDGDIAQSYYAASPGYDYSCSFNRTYDSVIQNLRSEVSTAVLGARGLGEGNLWESVAEYRQTVGMFSDVHGRFAARFEDLKNDLRRNALRVPNRIGSWSVSSYLAYRYGLSPLLSDLNTVFNAVRKKTRRMRVSTRRWQSATLGTTSTSVTGAIGNVRCMFSVSATEEVLVRAVALDDVVVGPPEHYGLTVKGAVSVPWDLITLSFVADQFVNVGDFLRSFAPTPGWNMLGGSVVVERTRKVSATAASTWHVLSSYSTIRPITGAVELERFEKTRSSGLTPSLVVRQDFLGENPGARVADWFALSAAKLRLFEKVLPETWGLFQHRFRRDRNGRIIETD
jgi:hypothetical protein